MKKKILIVSSITYNCLFRDYNVEVRNFSPTESMEKQIEDKDLILFTGGHDINPVIYGCKNAASYYSDKRDNIDIKVAELAIKNNIKLAGICRGFQFLNVINGGQMYQHIDNHEGILHNLTTIEGKTIDAYCTHHQMIKPSSSAVITAWAEKPRSDIYIFDDFKNPVPKVDKEYEAAYFPKINAFGTQYHPEMMKPNSLGWNYFLDSLEKYLKLNLNKVKNTLERSKV